MRGKQSSQTLKARKQVENDQSGFPYVKTRGSYSQTRQEMPPRSSCLVPGHWGPAPSSLWPQVAEGRWQVVAWERNKPEGERALTVTRG